jgi:hypothetical protein
MDFDCWDWKAVQDSMPGPDPTGTLRITGTCGKFPSDGYRLSLKQRRGGINPWEPFFDLIVTPPETGAPDVESDEPVEHVMAVSRDDRYTKVTIFVDDQPRWHVDVEPVS